MRIRISTGLIAAAAVVITSAPALALQEAPADKKQMVCKRDRVTGSIAQTKRVCMTREEWRKQADTSRDHADRLIRDATTIVGQTPT